MSYGSLELLDCQEKYILGELLVRTDWQVDGGARVTPAAVQAGSGQELKLDDCASFQVMEAEHIQAAPARRAKMSCCPKKT